MCQVQWIPPDPGVGLTFPAHAPCDRRLQLVRIVQAHRPERLQREVIYQIHDRIDEIRSEEHTSELQSRLHLVCRLLLEKKKKHKKPNTQTHYYRPKPK